MYSFLNEEMTVKAKLTVVCALFSMAVWGPRANAQSTPNPATLTGNIQHVLLISIDGMHALDFANCSAGIAGVNGGQSYCPHLAQLASTGVVYPSALTTRPSDSFPGMAAQVTGGTPRSHGLFYDVNYDRSLSPPAQTTPYGIVGGASMCPGNVGTQVGFDEEVDTDYTKLDGGGGINPNYLPRDPNNNCAPVWPHNYIRSNTIFEVVRASGGYTAWSDKHPSYEWLNGPSGKGLSDFYGPEINSVPVPLSQVPGCSPLPDTAAATSSNAWTDSFKNIMCYDTLKVQAVLNWIAGKTHDGSKRVRYEFPGGQRGAEAGGKIREPDRRLCGRPGNSLGLPAE
jgi:hypothetical protein